MSHTPYGGKRYASLLLIYLLGLYMILNLTFEKFPGAHDENSEGSQL